MGPRYTERLHLFLDQVREIGTYHYYNEKVVLCEFHQNSENNRYRSNYIHMLGKVDLDLDYNHHYYWLAPIKTSRNLRLVF